MSRFSKALLGIAAVAALMVIAANPALASPASVCPVMTGGVAGGGVAVDSTYLADSGAANGGCNILITFNADGSIVTTFPNAALSYDAGGDDTLVGIINNTGSAISSVPLSSTGQDIFGFDGDGACDPTWIFAGGNPCGTTTSGYGHQGVTFSGISVDFMSGVVNFAPSIAANGGSGWFSLEAPVDLSHPVTVTNTPEPSSFLLTGLGLICLLGVASLYRRPSASEVA